MSHYRGACGNEFVQGFLASIRCVHLTSIRQIWCAWLKSSCSALRNIKCRICNDMPDRLPFCFLRILFVSFAIRYLPFEENRCVAWRHARGCSRPILKKFAFWKFAFWNMNACSKLRMILLSRRGKQFCIRFVRISGFSNI